MTLNDYCWDAFSYRQVRLEVTEKLGDEYKQYYSSIEPQVRLLAAKRLQILEAFLPKNTNSSLLDFGCGTGRFVEAACLSGWDAYGLDRERASDSLIPMVSRQEANDSFWNVVTFFDVLEHLARPHEIIQSLKPKAIMVSIPECHMPGTRWFIDWKHRKPGEHLRFWNRLTLSQFMRHLGYRELMISNFEDEFRTPYEPGLTNIVSGIYARE